MGTDTKLQQWKEEAAVHLVPRIEGMLLRHKVLQPICDLDPKDLRGWHAVLHGGLLLHLSDTEQMPSMNGRYAWLHENFEQCSQRIQSLCNLLSTLSLSPPQILHLEDHSSEILGRVMGALLEIPVHPLCTSPQAPGLVVGYCSTQLSLKEQGWLATHTPQQTLWYHNTSSTSPPLYTSEITSYMTQHLRAPWEGALIIEHNTGDIWEHPPTTTSTSAVVEQLLRTSLEINQPVEEDVLPIAYVLDSLGTPHGAGWHRGQQQRRQAWPISPVPTSKQTQ